MKAKFTPAARQDLVDIADWIARDNSKLAIKFVRELQSKAEELTTKPEAFELLADSNMIRRRPFGRYLIFYRIDQTTVVILRILHGSRNYADIFG